MDRELRKSEKYKIKENWFKAFIEEFYKPEQKLSLSDRLFCEIQDIVAGHVEVTIQYEDDTALTRLDTYLNDLAALQKDAENLHQIEQDYDAQKSRLHTMQLTAPGRRAVEVMAYRLKRKIARIKLIM